MAAVTLACLVPLVKLKGLIASKTWIDTGDGQLDY